MEHKEHKQMEMSQNHGNHYKKLLIMTVLSFIAMYILMYSMANSLANVYPNINQFYMAGLMTMPMIIVELILMGKMYGNKKLNVSLISIHTSDGLNSPGHFNHLSTSGPEPDKMSDGPRVKVRKVVPPPAEVWFVEQNSA